VPGLISDNSLKCRYLKNRHEHKLHAHTPKHKCVTFRSAISQVYSPITKIHKTSQQNENVRAYDDIVLMSTNTNRISSFCRVYLQLFEVREATECVHFQRPNVILVQVPKTTNDRHRIINAALLFRGFSFQTQNIFVKFKWAPNGTAPNAVEKSAIFDQYLAISRNPTTWVCTLED